MLVVPEGKPPVSGWPIVLMLHGKMGSANRVMAQTAWDRVARREGFVAVFPNGTPGNESRPERPLINPQSWNGGNQLLKDEHSAEAKGIDDVRFLTELVETVASRTPIDRRRVFLAGHSNGACMAYRVASECPGLVAAVGVVAGHLKEGLGKLASSVSLLVVSGAADREFLLSLAALSALSALTSRLLSLFS